jgi:hypothetical protein
LYRLAEKKMKISRILLPVAAAMFLACASAPSGSRTDNKVLTRDEIAQSGLSGSAYDVISRLRPGFLVSRGQNTINGSPTAQWPNIYLDGVPYGDINTLKTLDSGQIAEIRLYQAWEAQTKFGMGNNGGVIAITTRR